MKYVARRVITAMVVPALGVFLFGCPKKPQRTGETPPPKVSESIKTSRPGSGSVAGAPETPRAGAGDQTEEQRLAQLRASRGEDIPIKEGPAVQFVEPAAEDKAVLKTVYFDYDKSNIKPEFQPVLEGIAKWLGQKPDRQLLIEGHCDERGTEEYNLALGERRALSVRRYLVALGIVADRLHTISYGEEKPADPGHDESAWAKNRRAEFKVSAQ